MHNISQAIDNYWHGKLPARIRIVSGPHTGRVLRYDPARIAWVCGELIAMAPNIRANWRRVFAAGNHTNIILSQRLVQGTLWGGYGD